VARIVASSNAVWTVVIRLRARPSIELPDARRFARLRGLVWLHADVALLPPLPQRVEPSERISCTNVNRGRRRS